VLLHIGGSLVDTGRQLSAIHVPCTVTTSAGEKVDRAVVALTNVVPVGWPGRHRLGNEIASVAPSPFALPALVRQASRGADGAVVKSRKDGTRFRLKETCYFIDDEATAGSDVDLVWQSNLTGADRADLHESATRWPDRLEDNTFFVVDLSDELRALAWVK
jgi:hypothetical protein